MIYDEYKKNDEDDDDTGDNEESEGECLCYVGERLERFEKVKILLNSSNDDILILELYHIGNQLLSDDFQKQPFPIPEPYIHMLVDYLEVTFHPNLPNYVSFVLSSILQADPYYFPMYQQELHILEKLESKMRSNGPSASTNYIFRLMSIFYFSENEEYITSAKSVFSIEFYQCFAFDPYFKCNKEFFQCLKAYVHSELTLVQSEQLLHMVHHFCTANSNEKQLECIESALDVFYTLLKFHCVALESFQMFPFVDIITFFFKSFPENGSLIDVCASIIGRLSFINIFVHVDLDFIFEYFANYSDKNSKISILWMICKLLKSGDFLQQFIQSRFMVYLCDEFENFPFIFRRRLIYVFCLVLKGANRLCNEIINSPIISLVISFLSQENEKITYICIDSLVCFMKSLDIVNRTDFINRISSEFTPDLLESLEEVVINEEFQNNIIFIRQSFSEVFGEN